MSDTMGNDVIRLIDVRKSFNGREVIRGVSIVIERGSTTFVVGQSGCGKSVLTRMIVGMPPPDAGDVIVFGSALSSLGDRSIAALRRRVALVPQMPALFDSMDVASNLAFPLVANRVADAAEANRRARSLLDSFDLGSRAASRPRDLNASDAKIVSILRSMMTGPECLILDEPTTGLDAPARAAVDGMIAELKAERRTTLVVISHDMRATMAIAGRIVFLYNGVIRLEGTPGDFAAAAAPGSDAGPGTGRFDPVVAQFLSGSPDGPMTVGLW